MSTSLVKNEIKATFAMLRGNSFIYILSVNNAVDIEFCVKNGWTLINSTDNLALEKFSRAICEEMR